MTYGWRGGTAFEVPPYQVPPNTMDVYFHEVDQLDSDWQNHAEESASGVTLTLGGWDTHNDNFNQLKTTKAGVLDTGLAGLFTSLAERGLLDTTAVFVTGEFGRTPKINARAGRDGRLLQIGARTPRGTEAIPPQRLLQGRVIGLDIHPGLNVDVVGDAHGLSRFLRAGSLDAVLSASVLEHLQAIDDGPHW